MRLNIILHGTKEIDKFGSSTQKKSVHLTISGNVQVADTRLFEIAVMVSAGCVTETLQCPGNLCGRG